MPLAEVRKVVSAYDQTVVDLVKRGGKVRALGIGYFELVTTKPSRRLSPIAGRWVAVPAKQRITFRVSRRK